MTTAVLAPIPNFQPLDNNGKVVPGGKVFTYAAGTTNKQATFTDNTGGTPNANPIILDASGRCNIWLSPTLAYKIVFSPSTDTDPPANAFWTVDLVGGSLTTGAVSGTTATFTGAVTASGGFVGTIGAQPSVSATAGSSPAPGTSQAQIWNNAGGILSLVDSSRTVNNRIAELIFTGGTLLGRFANDADNAFAAFMTVTGGQAAGLTSIAFGNAPVTLANLLDISAAGAGQIQFPATQNPSAGANVLDDYEEGTWTPVLKFGGASVGITFSILSGNYTKTGNWVNGDWAFTLSSKGSSAGVATITGLPFTRTDNNGILPIAFSALTTNWINVNSNFIAGGIFPIGNTAAGTSNSVGMANTDFSNTTIMQGTLSYPTA